MKKLVDLALLNSGQNQRYTERLNSNPNLAKFGCLPRAIDEISNDVSPWFCHGLAFRMATYSNDYFARWETLLTLAQNADGWQGEYAHWNNTADHWAKKWDKFHQFFWLLQCYEFFVERGHKVSFPASRQTAMPDLLVERQGQAAIHVECFFYTKWWHRELFLEDLLRFVDPNLTIKRTHHVAPNPVNNPISAQSDDQFIEALAVLASELTQLKLAPLRAAAQKVSPQSVCKIGDVSIFLEGSGEYQPGLNAHGDPAASWPVFVNEIITAKKNSNNLKGLRPNIVMANGLGVDFQLSFVEGSQVPELPCSIDEIWISACGIDEKLATCTSAFKKFRGGYAGSGL